MCIYIYIYIYICIFIDPPVYQRYTLVRGTRFSSKGREGKALYTPDRLYARFFKTKHRVSRFDVTSG